LEEDIFHLPRGLLLEAAGYPEAAKYRRLVSASREPRAYQREAEKAEGYKEAHEKGSRKLIERFKGEVQGLSLARKLVEPNVSEIIEPGTYDIIAAR
jgi:hypothetical protein